MLKGVFSASGEEVLERRLPELQIRNSFQEASCGGCQPEETLEEAYEINRCCSWIERIKVSRVALQFPDELLVDAPDVALAIEKRVGVEVFILGDTSYGSCCVDEITAEHVGADSLIHFGRACLSENKRLPVLYVFENTRIEKDPFLVSFKKTFLQSDHVLLASDLKYYKSLCSLTNDLQSHSNVILLEIDMPEECVVQGECQPQGGQVICGRRCNLPTDTPLDQWLVLYIGEEGVTLTNLMLTLNRCSFYTYNPRNCSLRLETLDVNRQLMKRYYKIEKAKDATMIGILVATLGVADYMQIIDRIKSLISTSGKKYYTFAVGKLNPAKLANFPEIDVYTLIACPENSLLDCKDFYRPVITPFELEIALNSARQWTGDYTTDFRQLLPGGCHYVDMRICDIAESDVSLVSGRMRTMGFDQIKVQDSSNQSLLPRSQSSSIVAAAAGDFLNQRHWQGLDPRLGEAAVTKAAPGRRGIAAGYHNEQAADEMRGKPDGQE